MLTKKQIQNLKEGDTVLVEAKVSSPLEYGAIVTHGCIIHALPASKLYPLPSEHGTLVPTPKHDPTRLFKKGDKVRVKNANGRHYNSWSKKVENQIFVVAEDEREHANVCLDVGGNRSYGVDPAYLELVTPVEEMEPFYLDEITDEDEDGEPYHCFMIKTLKGEDRVRTYYSNKFETIEQTKAAAEAERDRLNAEYRKEQNHV